MKNKKEIKVNHFFLDNYRWIFAIIIAILLTILVCGGILYSLTYTCVPVDSQHLWYADSLEHYLIFSHACSFAVLIVGYIAIIVFTVLDYLGTKNNNE